MHVPIYVFRYQPFLTKLTEYNTQLIRYTDLFLNV